MNVLKREHGLFRSETGRTPIRVAALAAIGLSAVNPNAGAQQLSNLRYSVPREPTPVVNAIPPQRAVYAAKFVCGIWDKGANVGKTAAQLNRGIGAAPPLPREHNTPPNLPDEPYYHDFQPGSYSTALNVFNPTRRQVTFNILLSSDSVHGLRSVGTVRLVPLNAARVGCADIELVLPDAFEGDLVEGFLHITLGSADLHVQAVYTYSTIAAFQEFRGGFADGFGDGPIAGAGAGAGGLGLGASVDIETVKPMVVRN